VIESRRGRTTPPRADQGTAAVGAPTPALMANLREQSSSANITLDCKEVFLVSITHLAFDRRLQVARKIAAYQRHRIKHLRRDGSTDAPAAYR
jgi:hypothetical protein